MPEDIQTTKQDVSDLIENFAGYVNPDGIHDPWFEITEINQQFAWDDVPLDTLETWLGELVEEGKVLTQQNPDGRQEWAWKPGADG